MASFRAFGVIQHELVISEFIKMSAGNVNGASGSNAHEGDLPLEERVNGSAGVVVENEVESPDQVAKRMQDLEVGNIPSLTEEEKKSIDVLLAQIKDNVKGNNEGTFFPAEPTQVKGKHLDLSMRTAVQLAMRLIKKENSSCNAELPLFLITLTF